MIYLFTDFGSTDIYVGQVKAELARVASGIPVIDLLHDAPAFDVAAGAHLLAALAVRARPGSVTLAVVDPGVGTSRKAVVVRVRDAWFVGPDNGLLSVLWARGADSSVWEIDWPPAGLSRTFHGRDLFAPVAGRLAAGSLPEDALRPLAGLEVHLGADDLARAIYIDHYGNVFSGLRGAGSQGQAMLEINGIAVSPAAVFAQAPAGQPFWYVNSIGLVEIALNRGNAAGQLGIKLGDPVQFRAPSA